MKLRRKLLAAGFAFGATALTLTTSTFAWYTNSSSVEAKSIGGATSTSVDSGSLYIAAAKTYDGNTIGAAASTFTQYTTTVQPVSINHEASASDVHLEPVAFTNIATATAATYNTMEASGSDVTYTAASNANNVVEYVLRFQVPNISADTKVYVSNFELTNSASASDTQQMALADNATLNVASTANNAVGIKEAGSYNVDMLHALKMTVVTTPVSFDSSTKKFTVITDSASAPAIYDLDAWANTSKDSNVEINTEASASTSAGYANNAIGYYNAVLGTSIARPTTYLSSATKIKAKEAEGTGNADVSNLFTVSKDTGYLEVRFTFWLDGWDEYCYDVCRKQNFTVKMNFSTKAADSYLVAVTE